MNKISDAEFEVLKELWNQAPQTASQLVLAVQKKRDWSKKTIRTLLDRLVQKEVVTVDKQSKEFLFTPCISQEEALYHQKQEMAEKYYGGSMGQMVLNFVQETPLSQEEVQQLQNYLSQIKKLEEKQ